jgi:hypothetical protein
LLGRLSQTARLEVRYNVSKSFTSYGKTVMDGHATIQFEIQGGSSKSSFVYNRGSPLYLCQAMDYGFLNYRYLWCRESYFSMV